MGGARCARMVLLAVVVAVPLAAWPSTASGSAGLRYECDGDSVTLAALRSPLGAERGSSPAAAALRRRLRSGARFDDGTRLRPTRWRVLTASADRVLFGSSLRPYGIDTIVATRDGEGWTASRPDFCELTRVGSTPFTLARRPRDGDRRLRVLIDVPGCGRPSQVLSVRRYVKATRRSVSVRLEVDFEPQEPPPSGVVCPMIGFFKELTVRLDQPLGRRALFDASHRPERLLRRRR